MSKNRPPESDPIMHADREMSSSRMDTIQAPIVPVIGDLIRADARHHFARPGRRPLRAAARGDRGGRDAPSPTGDARIPRRCAVCRRSSSADQRKLSDRERHRRHLAAAGSWSRPARTWPSCTRCSPSRTPGDEVILPVPFYFNHEMAIEMAGCTAVRVPTDDGTSSASTPSQRPSRRGRARSSRSRRTTRAARCSPKRRCARSTTLCRERGLYHIADEAVRVLHVRRGASRVAGLVCRTRAAHDLDVLAVEGVRVRRLA